MNLADVVKRTAEQRILLLEATSAVSEAAAGAGSVASSAQGLTRLATAAADAAYSAAEGLKEINADLDVLLARLRAGQQPLARMASATGGVNDFLATLGRLSRQAQLLSVNAAIESAHLADAGSRFAIVAQEIRTLSISTRTSSVDIGAIVSELRTATQHVSDAIDDSQRATGSAGREIHQAHAALGETQDSIVEFEQTTKNIFDVARAQRSSLDALGGSLEGITHHASEAAQASNDASLLDVGALIERANETALRWKLVSDRPPVETFFDEADPGIADALRALTEAVNADGRAILTDVVNVSIAVTRNGFAWSTITASVAGVQTEIETARAAIDEATSGARRAAELAAHMRTIVAAMERQYDEALSALEDALERIAGIARRVSEMGGLVDAMTGAAARVDDILTVIDTLSSETDLLSLNAAIEAAHAGDLGRGFGVIAEEIRTLALRTHASTSGVSELVSDVSSISSGMRETIADVGRGTDTVSQGAQRVRDAIASLRASFEGTLDRALDVSSTAEEQARALDRVRENVAYSTRVIDAEAVRTTEGHRLALATLGSRAHAIAARRSIGILSERIRALGERVCEHVEAAIEELIVRERTTVDHLFDFRYHEIVGPEIATLGRLFDVSCVPPEGFAPKKYAAPWDADIDESIVAILDAALDEAAWFRPLTMLTMDLNAFLYAYPKRHISDWRNDSSDLAGNRVKRINEDAYTLRLARSGLGAGVESLGFRATLTDFRHAGAELERRTERPWSIFAYGRDTSHVYNGLALAYYVGGMRHGTLRIIYDTEFI